VRSTNGSFVNVTSATISEMDEYGIYCDVFSSVIALNADIDNCNYGIYAQKHAYVNAYGINIDHDGVGGDGAYGCYAIRDSHIDADSDTMDTSGHITTDYSPAETTANDPTFGNRGSWIYSN
jgi:hypothetical protein